MTLPLASASGSKPKPKPPPRVISYEGGVPSVAAPSPPSVGRAIQGAVPRPAVKAATTWHAPSPAPTTPKVSPRVISYEGGVPSIANMGAYRKAVLAVFNGQSSKVQGALALKALKAPTLAGQIILERLRSETKMFNFNPASLPTPVAQKIPQAQVYTALIARGVAPPGAGPQESPALKEAMHAVLLAQPLARRQQILSTAQRIGVIKPNGDFFDALNFTAGRVADTIAGALGQLRNSTTPGGGNQIATIQGSSAGGQFAANAAKDLVSLPASTLTSVGTIAKDALTGHVGQAAKDVYEPFVQAAENPGKALTQHPLDTALMFTGLGHGATRLAAAPLRAAAGDSALGRALSTQREGVALTGNLTHERAPYSKSPTIKMQQKAVESSVYQRAPTGELIPRSKFLRDRQMNQGVGELVGTRERIRTANRTATILARERAVRPSVAARAAHSVKTALAYNPKGAVIPGAEVLARIADGTIRRPDTVVADLQKHLEQVAATRPDLLGDPQALKAHDAYVKELKAALANKRFLKDPGPAFKAAEAYAKDYASVEAVAHRLGHFGADMSREGLLRRTLQHYAVTHMGARMDPELGLVIDRALAEARHGGSEPVSAAPPLEPFPLSTEAIRKHLTGPEGVGGRALAYTPDRVSFDRSNRAFYVSSERRPLPATQRNTLYAYTHGLTRPGHDVLTEQHALLQGIVDSHHSQNVYLDTLTTRKPGGGYWATYQEAKRDAPPGYRPINVSQPFHPQAALDMATEEANPASIEEEAVRHSLDLRDRLAPGTTGRWAIIDERALKALRAHENQIQPNALLRTVRGLNNQFRTVALSTSAKHVPGVLQENIIRDIGHGVGFRSWITGRRLIKTAEGLNPERGRELRIQLTGGQVAGMTEAGKTYTVSDHWAGTSAYPFLRGMEAMMKAPGARQLRGLWRGWTRIAIHGTKRMLEEQHQLAGLGKAALREHGYAEAAKVDGFVGLFQRALGLHGRMLDEAARGLFDPAKARQMRAAIQQMYGKWTDLSPSAQTALMFSPFGLWWVNSARFLARMPVDQPVKTSLLAAANAGTQKERQKEGLDMFAPGALPLYEQGGIPLGGGKILAQNYYSPFGIANDPLATGQSLIQPWLTPLVTGSLGVNWLGRPLSSPGNPGGYKHSNVAQRAQYVIDSALASFVPLYTKAQQVLSGGASQYDVSGNSVLPSIPTPTKTPGQGLGAGLLKAIRPVREYSNHPKSSGGGALSLPSIGGSSVGGSGISSGTIR